MQDKIKAPVRPAETLRGQRKTIVQFIPLPFESVKHLAPRVARQVQSRMIDRVAEAGWPWDAQVSLMADALEIFIEEAESRGRVAAWLSKRS